jgi:hypothetical protein
MTIQQAPTPRTHRVHRFAGRLHEVLDGLGSPASWTMSHDELAETVAELASALPRVQALLLGLVATADALASGAVNLDQAREILHALAELPERSLPTTWPGRNDTCSLRPVSTTPAPCGCSGNICSR